jgi:benzoyl-CoA reductase/2-hydroxyglutaryl-CoA dehydratase subunit BcrC/BadD/HgdB
MNNDKYTEQELKDFIPRLENGRLNVKEFYENGSFATHGVDIVPYMTIQDKIDLLENEQKWLLEKIERYEKEGEKPLSLFVHLDRSKNDVIELTKSL